MGNPRIYLKINKSQNFISPVSGLIKELDKIYKTDDIVEASKLGYNDYTNNYIKHCDDTNMFYSEDYSYDPNTHIFNFEKICICNDEDYASMAIDPSDFDYKKKYDGSTKKKKEVTKNFLSEIKKNYANPGIESGFYIEDSKWNILVRNIKRHKNTMLTGPTGTGKTDVIIRICKALDIPCRIYDMGAMMDPLTDLLGSHRLENGSSKFDYAKFVKDIQEPGVILLDELSRAPVMTNNILFPCLDDRRMLPVEIADSNGPREIPVHPECTFIATANIGSEYSGTNSLDIALENRFMMIQVDYLPKSFETKVLNIRTGISENIAEKIVNVANAIRARYLDNSISKTISTRETLNCAELVIDGFSLIEAINYSFCEKFPKYGDNSEYDTIKKLIMGF